MSNLAQKAILAAFNNLTYDDALAVKKIILADVWYFKYLSYSQYICATTKQQALQLLVKDNNQLKEYLHGTAAFIYYGEVSPNRCEYICRLCGIHDCRHRSFKTEAYMAPIDLYTDQEYIDLLALKIAEKNINIQLERIKL